MSSSSPSSMSTSSGDIGAAAIAPSAPSSGGLAFTGVSPDVIVLGVVAGLSVLAGIGLVVLGTRRMMRRRPSHS
jgi:hypothetical protein